MIIRKLIRTDVRQYYLTSWRCTLKENLRWSLNFRNGYVHVNNTNTHKTCATATLVPTDYKTNTNNMHKHKQKKTYLASKIIFLFSKSGNFLRNFESKLFILELLPNVSANISAFFWLVLYISLLFKTGFRLQFLPWTLLNLRPSFCARSIMINRRAETGPCFFFGFEYSLADQTFKLF